jgi:putative DNA methylase
MTWDFAEINPFSPLLSNLKVSLREVTDVLRESAKIGGAVNLLRCSATELPYPDSFFDAVVTDPPYYDNISYAALSDFFYVWLKRLIGPLFPEHLSGHLTPKKREVVADSKRHGGRKEARLYYEETMSRSLEEAWRVLKDHAPLVMVYAHKTIAGWSALVEALRKTGFAIMEAWPIRTERPGRLREMGSSALASSVFLVARKRERGRTGSFEGEVEPSLVEYVGERVNELFSDGTAGADILIACIAAGLKAFTRYERVEYANGEEVTTEKYLHVVEGLVLETLLRKLFDLSTNDVSGVDPPTRFYLLWRYTFGTIEIDAGEAIVFAYPLGLELDGPSGLSAGENPLLEKVGKKYRLRDFTERGATEPSGTDPGSTIGSLHRLLWLLESEAYRIPDFLKRQKPEPETLKLTAQALADARLTGSRRPVVTTPAERSAVTKLLANWESVVRLPTGT